MPRIEFSELPDDARLWVFASERQLTPAESERLLRHVDVHLESWAAHGAPLRSARDVREERFLAIGVDQRTAGASGCSIDGLFRVLRELEGELGTRLTAGGLVFARTASGEIEAMSRDEFSRQSAAGALTGETPVFDTSLTSVADYRERFEIPAGRSWHAALLDAPATR